MSKNVKNLNKNQEVSMKDLESTETVSVENQKGFLQKVKETVKTHKNVLIAAAVGAGLGVFAGSSLQKKKLEGEVDTDYYGDDETNHIDDQECLELMNEDNMSETEEVVE